MAIKIYKPTSPGRRGMSVSTFEEITPTPAGAFAACSRCASGPAATMTAGVTVRHRGGGHKRLYRVIDFKRDKIGVPGRVASIEYDPEPLGPHRAGGLSLTARSATSWRRWI